jgi:ferredoxin-NADP reductase
VRGDKVLLVAGGIGVTPLRAMLDRMMKEGWDVVLVYAARTAGDVVFRSEIESFIPRGLQVHYVYSRESGEPRRIDQDLLSELVPDAAEREVFICGPEPMMAAVERVLRKIGVSRKKIYTEAFAF